MIENLGISGRLKTVTDWLTTYWTAARAAKVDNLDAAISTRAPAATAIAVADYEADITALSASILTRMAGIKAIYTGWVTINVGQSIGYAAITAVNLSKSICLLNGFTTEQAYLIGTPALYLSSTINVAAEVRQAVVTAPTLVRYTVVEFL